MRILSLFVSAALRVWGSKLVASPVRGPSGDYSCTVSLCASTIGVWLSVGAPAISVAVTTQNFFFMFKLIVIFAWSFMREQAVVEFHAITIDIFFLNNWVSTLVLIYFLDFICLVDVLE